MKLSEMMSVGRSMTSHTIEQIAALERDLAAAQAERDDANEECGYRIKERDEARADLAAAQASLNRSVLHQQLLVATHERDEARAEAAALKEELERLKEQGAINGNG